MQPQKTELAAAAAERLLAWYSTHFRPLPWRQQPTPYRVWVSEIMLQQTRIEAVLPYYERFMRALPDVAALAAVPTDQLLKLWEGLGYYSRARNLQKAAQQLCRETGGELPADYAALLKLPGIGEYTAGAIASIAFGQAVPAVDGNVMRVLARLTGDSTDVLSAGAKAHFAAIAREMLPPQQPGRFNQALMELGETVCLPKAAPACDSCPWQPFCAACAGGLTDLLPVRARRKPRRIEQRQVAVVLLTGEVPRVLLHRRPPSGLLAGLWELPNALEGQPVLPEALPVQPLPEILPAGKHIFSHVEWHMTGKLYRLTLPPGEELPADYAAVTLEQLQASYALPSAFRLYAAQLPAWIQKEAETWTKEPII